MLMIAVLRKSSIYWRSVESKAHGAHVPDCDMKNWSLWLFFLLTALCRLLLAYWLGIFSSRWAVAAQ